MQKLYKEHAREYSLFRVYSWHLMMGGHVVNLLGENMDTIVMVYKGKNLVENFYPVNYIEKMFGLVANYAQDVKKTKQALAHFYEMFTELLPYFKQEKIPQDVIEFKKVFELYCEFYAHIGLVFIIPSLENVDGELKKMAFQAREKTQEYNEALEPVIKEFLENNYPYLKGMSRFVLPEEVWGGEVEQVDYLEKIKFRKSGFIMKQGKLYIGRIDKICQELNIELVIEDNKDVTEIKGQVAQLGKVRGKVKILESSSELDKVEEGDILVASMTMPNYLPAMKKAAAFVTDEGGITCHAAIVSRELKKPCVIGTKIATQVLKDGMEVEVDADQGIIKILK